jgi:dethiobiotin synthetase
MLWHRNKRDMHHGSIFVTGTDTGVGKTVVSAALLAAFRDAGVDAVPMKPIQTGCKKRGGGLAAPDLDFMLRTAGILASPEEQDLMCPYRFEPACSPHLAAKMAKKVILPWKIKNSFRKLAEQHEMVIVEGAGGVLVPIGGKKMMIDLIAMLKLPVVLVARPGLGTINHTLLSLGELRRAGAKVLGVIFNETKKIRRGFVEADNRKMIEWLSGVPVIGGYRYTPGLDKKEWLPRSSQRTLRKMVKDWRLSLLGDLCTTNCQNLVSLTRFPEKPQKAQEAQDNGA